MSTEDKNVKTRNVRTEKLFRALLDSSPIGIYIIQDRKFELVSPQFQKITGYSEDELLGMDSFELVFIEDRDSLKKNAVKMLRGKLFSPYDATPQKRRSEPDPAP